VNDAATCGLADRDGDSAHKAALSHPKIGGKNHDRITFCKKELASLAKKAVSPIYDELTYDCGPSRQLHVRGPCLPTVL
jgi:hypothetical protein